LLHLFLETMDYGDVVVHIFDKDARFYYSLEELWADAERIDWKQD
jgi:ribosome-associated protein